MTENTLGNRKTVLVVDDSEINIRIMGHILKAEYKVKVARSGEKALAIAQRSPPPDLILLDIMMPEMDGIEVCRRLKSGPATADIPVIFATGMVEGESEELEEGMALGASGHITKPANPHDLLEIVGRTLSEND